MGMNQMKTVSFQARSLLSNVLCVDVGIRFSLSQIKAHSWFHEVELIDEPEYPCLTLDQQMEVARNVQSKLKLAQWKPEQILAYVMSAKGRLGKTAGCFNLLARDMQMKSKQQPTTIMVKPPVFLAPPSTSEGTSKPKTTVESSIHKSMPLTDAKPGTSFWETGEGKAAVFALSQLRPEVSAAETTPVKCVNDVQKHDDTTKPLVVKPFFQPENLWRRSVNPSLGKSRLGRLKRVEGVPEKAGSRKPLSKIDHNVKK